MRGQGTFVSERAAELTEAGKLERLRPSVHRLLNDATLLNVSIPRLQRLIVEEGAELAAARRKSPHRRHAGVSAPA